MRGNLSIILSVLWQNQSLVGCIFEILHATEPASVDPSGRYVVVIERFNVSSMKDERLNMPMLERVQGDCTTLVLPEVCTTIPPLSFGFDQLCRIFYSNLMLSTIVSKHTARFGTVT
jgi:hypothetical protein